MGLTFIWVHTMLRDMRRRLVNGWRYDGSGSKALAVVSCALAILAAHPLAAQALSERDGGAELVAVGAAGKTSAPVIRASDDLVKMVGKTREEREKVGEEGVGQGGEGMLLQLQRLGALIVREFSPGAGERGTHGNPMACLAERTDGGGLIWGVEAGGGRPGGDRWLAFDAIHVYAITRLLLPPPAAG